MFAPFFRETGFLNVTSNAASAATKLVTESYYSSIRDHKAFKDHLLRIDGLSDVKKLVPAFEGPVDGWAGYFNGLAGYSHSANALKAVYDECVRLGVKFHLGMCKGKVESLLYNEVGGVLSCRGARTVDGRVHIADRTIVALGAEVSSVLPRLAKQVEARCWGVVHIQLTQAEAASLRGIPVTNVRDLGFFFEPDEATNKLKFCHMGGGFTNYNGSKAGQSLPYPTLEESQFVPAEDEVYIRRLLRDALPQFADRPLIDAHLCWFADTKDSDFIIDYVPKTNSSLVVLSGDSGHGFKMLPIFGEFVKKLLEEGAQTQQKWQWNETEAGRENKASSWRSGVGQELVNIHRACL